MRALKVIATTLLGVAAILTSLTSLAAERAVSFTIDGQRVVGTLLLPDRSEKPPVVLMLHGFGGSRDEWKSWAVPEGLFGRAAPVLAQQGIASLRIDFRGSGQSDGKFEDVTIESEIRDALAALDFLAADNEVNKSKISVLGMSLGGIVATAVAGRSKHSLSSVVLWNPGINPPAAFMTMFGVNTVRDGAASGDQPVVVPVWSITLKGGFFRSLFSVVPAAELEKYRGPVLLAVGTADSIVWPQPVSAQALLSYHNGPHELWVRPVDHGFNLMQNGDTVDALIHKTAEFLQATSK